jgi:hypothetical protein
VDTWWTPGRCENFLYGFKGALSAPRAWWRRLSLSVLPRTTSGMNRGILPGGRSRRGRGTPAVTGPATPPLSGGGHGGRPTDRDPGHRSSPVRHRYVARASSPGDSHPPDALVLRLAQSI